MNNGCMLCVGRWCSTWLESTCSHGVMTQWLHVVCREVVLHLARVNMQPWCHEQWLHVVCREVVLHLARVREMVYEQWLHVVCREVVLQWLE